MENINPETIQNYINILEKTNQQLSLWYNPYGVIVGALAILFTALTIVAVFIIYRQGSDYKNKIEIDRKEYKRKLDEYLESQASIIEKNSKVIEEISQKIEAQLIEYKKKFKESSKEQKDEIQRVIDKIELEKSALKVYGGMMPVLPDLGCSSMFPYSSSSRVHKCSKCGFGFYLGDSVTSVYITPRQELSAMCPKCGNVDVIRLFP